MTGIIAGWLKWALDVLRGHTADRVVIVGTTIENAIRFKRLFVEFDGDVCFALEKIKPEIEKINYSLFWTVHTKCYPDVHTTSDNKAVPYTHVLARAQTHVHIRPTSELEPTPRINWAAVVE